LLNLEVSIDVNNLPSEDTNEIAIKAVKNLKNSKAPGLDDIVNEYLKTTVTKFLTYYAKLFNLIFDSGESPDSLTRELTFYSHV
jgi:hypothetical protein